jgi:predicted Zn-dependent protease with MMP-like domain
MDRTRFENLVGEALAQIPSGFKRRLENIAVMVEDFPPRGSRLLGIYHGVPYKHRGSYYGNIPPDVIVIYQKPIERISRSEDEIKENIREVVLHEIGHYFGMEEGELRAIERARKHRGKE